MSLTRLCARVCSANLPECSWHVPLCKNLASAHIKDRTAACIAQLQDTHTHTAHPLTLFICANQWPFPPGKLLRWLTISEHRHQWSELMASHTAGLRMHTDTLFSITTPSPGCNKSVHVVIFVCVCVHSPRVIGACVCVQEEGETECVCWLCEWSPVM